MLKIESIQKRNCDRSYPGWKRNGYLQASGTGLPETVRCPLQSVRSEKYGCKDLIKIEGLTEPERLEVLGYLNEGVTLIVIRDGKVVKKYHPVPPETNCQGLFNQIHKNLQKRCQKHRMAPDTSFDRLHFSVQQVFA